eukprot:TRINITY_DN4679_c0_g1_i1.p1 TRINITY_DN4679_c0_g1~~TRINITY_DN4679_c0_g1_i1.p1  ORF type:complete len:408 (+),score=67.70 TRINITY_DN4679_c0_g1_i1:36-1226(+)
MTDVKKKRKRRKKKKTGTTPIQTQGRAKGILKVEDSKETRLLNQSKLLHFKRDCVRLANVEGKGRAFVAVKKMGRGVVVMEESSLNAKSYDELIDKVIENQATFAYLHHNPSQQLDEHINAVAEQYLLKCADKDLPREETLAIFKRSFLQIEANAFRVTIDNVEHICLFPTTSFFNHSCYPNAELRNVEENSFACKVALLRDVDPGDEICISYLSPQQLYQPQAERQKVIVQNPSWNFKCKCSRCNQPPPCDSLIEKKTAKASLKLEKEYDALWHSFQAEEAKPDSTTNNFDTQFSKLKELKARGEFIFDRRHWKSYALRENLLGFCLRDCEDDPTNTHKTRLLVKLLLLQLRCEEQILPRYSRGLLFLYRKYHTKKWVRNLPEYKQMQWRFPVSP